MKNFFLVIILFFVDIIFFFVKILFIILAFFKKKEKKFMLLKIFILFFLTFFVCCFAQENNFSSSTTLSNNENLATYEPILNLDWTLLQTIPIQSQGRIKPLDSFARLLLFQLSGRTTVSLTDMRISAIQWLSQVIFLPHEAIKYPIFLVENAAVLEQIHLSTERMRARYSYIELAPGISEIQNYCWQLRSKPEESYSLVDRQILTLANNLRAFEDILGTFLFLEPLSIHHKDLGQKIDCLVSTSDIIEFLSNKEEPPPEFTENINSQKNINTSGNSVEKIRQIWKSLALDQKDVFLEAMKQELKYRLYAAPEKDLDIFPDYPKWSSPWKSLVESQEHHKTALAIWKNILYNYQQKNVVEVEKLLIKYQNMLKIQVGGMSEYQKLPLEVRYNQYDLLFWAKIVYLLAMLFCATSWWGKAEKKIFIIAFLFLVVGFVLQSYGMFLRILIKGRPPVANLYETMVFVSWFAVLMTMVLEIVFRNRIRSLSIFCGSFVGCLLLFMAEKFAYETDTMGVLIAVLDSNFWLAIHVISITIGYSASLVAGIIAHIFVLSQFLLQKSNQKQGNINQQRYSDLEHIIYGTVAFATVFIFLGTVLGGFWADQSWGRFWGWDPKENGALVLLLWNAVILHARSGGYIRSWGIALSAILGNIIVAAAWWGVNLLNIGLHSYGFSHGVRDRLLVFVSVEIIILLLSAVIWRKQNVE